MQEIIAKLLAAKPKSRDDLMAIKRKLSKKYGQEILSNANVLRVYKKMVDSGQLKRDEKLEKILRKRSIRTMSGIAPVAVLTKPFPCPGQCAYCPTEKNVPKSYLSNEPAVMRAIRCDYNPYVQVQLRLRALEANGHEPTKIELIVIGGTWSVLPSKYQYWYIANCFKAANDFHSQAKTKPYPQSLSLDSLKKVLQIEQTKNEKAKYNIIGVTLETRPDYIDEKELIEMREFGCTRVELGVQSIFQDVLDINKRGHGVIEIAQATQLLRDFGFKITYHLMPGLPGSTSARDVEMFEILFNDERFQPDQIKFYPTVVTAGSLLYKWWKAGKYQAYSDDELKQLIIDCKKIVPPYVRIIRLIRDIPGESILAGNKITNLRQVLEQQGVKCNCIRCREASDDKFFKKDINLVTREYSAADGREFFLSYESKDKKILYGFCRLRLPESNKTSLNILNNTAIIRELHVYGNLVSIGAQKSVQHSGIGKMLMQHAEKIAKKNKYLKVAVISGVGVRGYYKKLGYKLQSTYMIKKFK